MLVMETARLEKEMKGEMKDMENRVTERLQVEIAATSLGLREQIGAQFAGLMDLLAKNGQLVQGQGNGRNNIGNGAAETSGLEEKQEATPARQNLNFIYGSNGSKIPTSAVNASRADSQRSLGDGGATINTATISTVSDDEELSEADQLRLLLAQGNGQLSAGENTPTGDPFRAFRDQYKDKGKHVSHGQVLTAALRAASSYLGVSGQLNDLISIGAESFVIMLIEKKLIECFQAKTTTPEEDKIMVRMQKLQDKDKIDMWSGRPPLCGWPNDLFQVPAGDIPNVIKTVKNINGIFRLLHTTLCDLSNGNSLETAMGVGEMDEKFMAPGANITIMKRLYKLALASIDSTLTVAGVAQQLRDFWSEYAYNAYDVPADLLRKMSEVMSEIGRKVRLIGDLNDNKMERKAELLTDPQDMMTWIAYARSVAMAENNGVYSMTVVNVIDKLLIKFTDMVKDKEDLDVYELSTTLSLLAQACQNIQSTALSGLNKMLKGRGPVKFKGLVPMRPVKTGNPEDVLVKKNQGPESKKRKQNDNPRGKRLEVGGGSTGGSTQGNGNGSTGGSTQGNSNGGCYLTVKSERPWGDNVFDAKDALTEIARNAKALGYQEKFTGYLVRDPSDPKRYNIKFPDPETAQRMQRAIDGSSLDGVPLQAAVTNARANRARANVWVRRAVFDSGDDNDDAMSMTSSLTDNMSTASGYSSAVEQATARRATGSMAGGAASGGASRSAPGVVLSADQTEDLRDVLNAATEARGVQLVQQPDGGVGVAQSLVANSATAGP